MAEDDPKPAADTFDAPLSLEDLEAYYWEIRAASRDGFAKERKHFKRNWNAYGSDFLEPDWKQYLIDTERPPVELNLLTSKINAVRGSIAAGRMEAQFKPHTSDWKANVYGGWMTLLLRKAMVNCGGLEAQDGVFHDCLITGYGAATVYLDTSRVPHRGVLRQVELDDLDPDPDAREMCLADRSFDLRHRKWLVEQAIASYPAKEQEIRQHATRFGTSSRRAKGNRRQAAEDSIRGQVEMAELVYQRWVPRVRWYDPERKERRDTRPADLAKRRKELDAVRDANGNPMFDVIVEEPYHGETWYRAVFLVGEAEGGKAKSLRSITLLDHRESPRVGSTFLWCTQLAKKDPVKKTTRFFSLLDIAYGLQMVLNRTIQEELAILAREAKGGAWYTPEAVPDGYPGGPAQWVKDTSKPGAFNETTAEALAGGLIKDKELPRIPAGLDRLEDKLVNWIGQAMAITEAFVGSVEREQSAVSLSNLQQQGMVTLGPVLGPYIKFVKDSGTALVELLIRHLPAKDIDRILGNPEVEDLTHEKDPETGELVPILMDDPDDPGTLQPAIDPMTGGPVQEPDPETGEMVAKMETVYEQIPITAGYLLKQENPLDFQVNVDTGQLTISLRYAIWELFQQGVLQTMQNALPPSAFQQLVKFMVRNLPVPGEGGATLEKDIEAAIEQDAQLQTEQGITEFLVGMGAERAMPLLEQVMGALQGQMPQGGAPEEMVQ